MKKLAITAILAATVMVITGCTTKCAPTCAPSYPTCATPCGCK